MSSSAPPVVFTDNGKKIVMDNGTVKVTISKPAGLVTAISYNGIENLLSTDDDENSRGYWDMNWSETDAKDIFTVPFGAEFRVIYSDSEKLEVSFFRPFDTTRTPPSVPLTIDKRFVMLRGSSGFYSYGIYDRPAGWRDFNLNQTRIVFMLRKDKFRYMALDDKKLKLMPYPDDLSSARSEQLAYKEAHLLTNPTDPSLNGEVDDKYMYSCDDKDNRVHGWMSKDDMIGFWMITASNEFRNGGPTHQDLTSHTGPACLSMFHSAHYGGIELCPQFRNGEAWRKVFGPVFVYLNSKPGAPDVRALWDDAKLRMLEEEKAWPYAWPSSSDYPKAKDRAQVSGQILVQDKYATDKLRSGTNAFLGLAMPGERGSWQKESKVIMMSPAQLEFDFKPSVIVPQAGAGAADNLMGYQFWTQADKSGYFSIQNIRPGTYDLYGWLPGVVGDYIREGNPITVNPGDNIQLDSLTFGAPRYAPTVWEIGYPDRTALGFYIPDPNPKYVNKLFLDFEKYRQYGLWWRYAEIYPTQDLVYTVGTSDWTKDWFFAHVNRRNDADGTYKATTWQIKFRLTDFNASLGAYKLWMAIAASNQAAIQVKVNDPSSEVVFDTQQFGRDNAIARHGIHGLYTLFEADIPAASLEAGDNSIYLTQRKTANTFNGLMYDYLRLEAPPI